MSLVATKVQNWRVSNPQFDSNMTRACEYGALNFFAQQTQSPQSIISPLLRAQAIESMGKTLQIPVIKYDGDVTVKTSRACTIEDAENTSALYTVVFATYGVGFTMVPALYSNNDIAEEHDFARKMEKVTRALANALDAGAVAALAANKTQVFKDLLLYQETGNVIGVPWDLRTEIIGDINPIMRANCYTGGIHIIGNAGIDSLMQKLAQLGPNNAVNKVLEYAGKTFHYSNNVTNEVGVFGTGFAVEENQVGILTRSGRENVRGTVSNFHEWGVINLPILGLPVDFHYYTAVGDQSSIAGGASADMVCNVKEYYGFEVDVAFIVAYNSDPEDVANPVIQFEIGQSGAANPVAQPVTIVNGESNPVHAVLDSPLTATLTGNTAETPIYAAIAGNAAGTPLYASIAGNTAETPLYASIAGNTEETPLFTKEVEVVAP